MFAPQPVRALLRPGLRLLLGACLLLAGTACQEPDVSGLPPEALVSHNPTGTLTAGDVLRISFSGTPELNQVHAIQADGKLSLPLIGDVTASGKTLKAFQDELTRLYKAQLQNTQVTVVQEKSEIPVTFYGAIGRPGRLVLDERTTVLEAIMQAGGPSNIGNMSKVRIIRTVNGKHYTQIINLTPAMQGKASTAFYVRYGDIIFIPEKLF